MAGLPPDGGILIQQIGGQVIIFDRYTEHEFLRIENPSDANTMAKAQKAIYDLSLDPEQKCFAHFWCGYFYGHVTAFVKDEF